MIICNNQAKSCSGQWTEMWMGFPLPFTHISHSHSHCWNSQECLFIVHSIQFINEQSSWNESIHPFVLPMRTLDTVSVLMPFCKSAPVVCVVCACAFTCLLTPIQTDDRSFVCVGVHMRMHALTLTASALLQYQGGTRTKTSSRVRIPWLWQKKPS